VPDQQQEEPGDGDDNGDTTERADGLHERVEPRFAQVDEGPADGLVDGPERRAAVEGGEDGEREERGRDERCRPAPSQQHAGGCEGRMVVERAAAGPRHRGGGQPTSARRRSGGRTSCLARPKGARFLEASVMSRSYDSVS